MHHWLQLQLLQVKVLDFKLSPSSKKTPISYCQSQSTPTPHQLGYLGVFPGNTTDEQVVQLFAAKPMRIEAFSGEWIFPNGLPTVLVEDGIVTYLYTELGTDEEVTLQNLLTNYGCPDLAYVIDTSIHATDNSFGTLLVYLEFGAWFFFESAPLKPTTLAYSVAYFRRGSRDEYDRLFPSIGLDEELTPWKYIVR